ncbi:MAG: KamA family radical SAM protein [Candidatus Bipolaricaulis sp.]|nr:KamA family radical SAM protein [Candidatus Bipolaricaulis sp.]
MVKGIWEAQGATGISLWDEDRNLLEILRESATYEEAREALRSYLDDLEAAHRDGVTRLDRVERALALNRTAVLKEMLALQNEAIVGFSTGELLWRLAQDGDATPVSQGFILEVCHILRAIHGVSGTGRGWLTRAVDEDTGLDTEGDAARHSAQVRSEFLDGLATEVAAQVSRYPCGLDDELVERREVNRRRIQRFLGATDAEWDDGGWQMAHVFKAGTGLEALRQLVPLSRSEDVALRLAVRHEVPWGITPYYLSLFDARTSSGAEDGQVRSQVIPPVHTVRSMIEHRRDRGTALDFMREGETSPADGVTRRYAGVAILKLCDTCPQICVYCQRNWEISEAMALDRAPTLGSAESALRWFEEHPGISDVLITGGDPLVASDEALCRVLERLSRMDHVMHIRIGTRVPVTVPMRITDELAERLASYIVPGRRQVAIVTHVESAYEITPALASAIDRLRRHGLRVYNQQVFTVQTSRRFQTAANRIALKRVGIDPYYTFYPKGKDEHREYLVPVARLLQERKEEARVLPGMFRTDESVFNVPGLGKNHLRARQDREWVGIRADGRRVYLFHPWEKGVAQASPWAYTDVSIAEYLEHLAELGEDPSDYESIWYYT